ncbi:MAG: hypothetical protein EZS28_013986 [Streblomastix strix]|uniref:Uncharacterized protein n=1 Tax=Streblomastix strix TaxID=222440 RepID=A0A5J4W6K4_9EUKA|nr:MAG: hypothetical protein EZS28_013986 [Streblomastix strix]
MITRGKEYLFDFPVPDDEQIEMNSTNDPFSLTLYGYVTSDGRLWSSKPFEILIEQIEKKKSSMPGWLIALIVISVALFIVALITLIFAIIVFVRMKNKSRYKKDTIEKRAFRYAEDEEVGNVDLDEDYCQTSKLYSSFSFFSILTYISDPAFLNEVPIPDVPDMKISEAGGEVNENYSLCYDKDDDQQFELCIDYEKCGLENGE